MPKWVLDRPIATTTLDAIYVGMEVPCAKTKSTYQVTQVLAEIKPKMNTFSSIIENSEYCL